MYGYGGFSNMEQPKYQSEVMALVNNLNALYVIPNIRGGGEYGEKWHKSAIKDKKQNTYDDFIGAAEYLIQKGFTDSKHLVIQGASNGGTLVISCANQRPDLFAAVIGDVPVTDMLRY